MSNGAALSMFAVGTTGLGLGLGLGLGEGTACAETATVRHVKVSFDMAADAFAVTLSDFKSQSEKEK